MTTTIVDGHNDFLTALLEDSEVKVAVFGLNATSAPGPDGFSGVFYQKCWPIIQQDLVSAVRHFFHHIIIPNGVNSSFVALIPKTPDAIRVENFYPIVMGNYLFKIFTKILASRLGSFIGQYISPLQFGFIPGRQIHTCIALASEAVNCFSLGRFANMAVKIDMTKAFDTISWHFLRTVLQKMGFSQRFIQMVSSILHSARLSILMNGSPHGYFACSRGVR